MRIRRVAARSRVGAHWRPGAWPSCFLAPAPPAPGPARDRFVWGHPGRDPALSLPGAGLGTGAGSPGRRRMVELERARTENPPTRPLVGASCPGPVRGPGTIEPRSPSLSARKAGIQRTPGHWQLWLGAQKAAGPAAGREVAGQPQDPGASTRVTRRFRMLQVYFEHYKPKIHTENTCTV